MIKFINHIIGPMKEFGVLRTIGHGIHQASVFAFCQLCGLGIIGKRKFFKKGPIN